MTLRKLFAGILGLTLLAGGLALGAAHSQAASSQARVVSVLGVAKVEGQDAVVEILVEVLPGENASEKGQAALHRMYPDARPFSSADYTTSGLVWDVFLDGNSTNDQVDVRYNSNGVPGNYSASEYLNSFLNAQATWTDVATSNFVFHDAGTTGKCPSLVRECKGPQTFDGNNDTGWLPINESGVLGVTWYGTQTDEFDMVLDNADFTWYVGPSGSISTSAYDAQTVWLHELGHGLGLGHSSDPNAVMYAYYSDLQRDLADDDVNGITALYPAGGEPTPTPTPTPVPGSTVTVASITYAWYGGKSNNKHLNDTLLLNDENGNPVAGATVSITLTNDIGGSWNGTGTTGSEGSVTFSLKNAPSACYSTEVTSVSAPGWDNTTPSNSSCPTP